MKDVLLKQYGEFKTQFLGIAAMQEQINTEMPVDGDRKRIQLPGREIEVIIYRSKKTDAPTMFCSFGGGFVMGGCALDNLMWKSLSDYFECNVISIGYRRAPKYKFPNAVNDVYDTICTMVKNAKEYRINTESIWVFGASAGANLSTGAAILDNQKGTHFIKKQILCYPYLDLFTDPEEKGHNINELLMYYLFPDAYTDNVEERKNPLVSPLYAQESDLRGLPDTIIICGENDPLRIEGEKYVDMLTECDVSTLYHKADKMEHGFLEFSYSLQYTPLEQSFCSDSIKKMFSSGELVQERDEVLKFIKSHIQ